jgi:hypothetical protein
LSRKFAFRDSLLQNFSHQTATTDAVRSESGDADKVRLRHASRVHTTPPSLASTGISPPRTMAKYFGDIAKGVKGASRARRSLHPAPSPRDAWGIP